MFKSLKDTFDKSVAAVSVKSESIVESSRVRTAISTAQKQMETEINALGAAVYNSWQAGGVDQEALEAACKKIQGIQDELNSLKAKLEQIKLEESQILGTKAPQAVGTVFCINCGKQLSAGVRFCDACGTPVK